MHLYREVAGCKSNIYIYPNNNDNNNNNTCTSQNTDPSPPFLSSSPTAFSRNRIPVSSHMALARLARDPWSEAALRLLGSEVRCSLVMLP